MSHQPSASAGPSSPPIRRAPSPLGWLPALALLALLLGSPAGAEPFIVKGRVPWWYTVPGDCAVNDTTRRCLDAEWAELWIAAEPAGTPLDGVAADSLEWLPWVHSAITPVVAGQTELTLSVDIPPGTYYRRMRVLTAAGVPGCWSDVRRFYVALAPGVPGPVLDSGLPGDLRRYWR